MCEEVKDTTPKCKDCDEEMTSKRTDFLQLCPTCWKKLLEDSHHYDDSHDY